MTQAEAEQQAVEIVFERKYGQHLAFDQIADDEKAIILGEIRARQAEIERHVTHDLLIGKISQRRQLPSRHILVVLALLAVVSAIAFVIAIIADLH